MTDESLVSQDNLIKAFQRGRETRDGVLVEKCVEFACEHIESVVRDPELFDQIPIDLLLDIKKRVELELVPGFFPAFGHWVSLHMEKDAIKAIQALDLSLLSNDQLVKILKKLLPNGGPETIKDLAQELSKVHIEKENLMKLDNIAKVYSTHENKDLTSFAGILSQDEGQFLQVGGHQWSWIHVKLKEPIRVDYISWKTLDINGEVTEIRLYNTEEKVFLKKGLVSGENFVKLEEPGLVKGVDFVYSDSFLKMNFLQAILTKQ